MISLDFRIKSPAGFHKLAGIIISKRCNRCTTVQPTYKNYKINLADSTHINLLP